MGKGEGCPRGGGRPPTYAKHAGTQYHHIDTIINHNPKGCRWTRSDARGIDRGRAVQQSQAKDFADRVKNLTRDTAIGKQRMPENQRENAEEKISSTLSSSSRNQSGRGHRTKKFENYSNEVGGGVRF